MTGTHSRSTVWGGAGGQVRNCTSNQRDGKVKEVKNTKYVLLVCSSRLYLATNELLKAYKCRETQTLSTIVPFGLLEVEW